MNPPSHSAVRPLQDDELAMLEQAVPYRPWPSKHAERLARQTRGEAVYLIVWLDGRPVGHALLHWRGPTEAAVAEEFADCAMLEDVFIHPTYRSRGLGRALLQAAEREVALRGFPRLGFAVGVGNHRARTFYRRLGYHEARRTPFRISWKEIDSQGRVRVDGEDCTFFVKEL